MDALTSKIASMLLLGGISMLVGLFPILLKRCCGIGGQSSDRGKFFLSALSCFGGGVILTTCFTHMLPEVTYFLRKNIEQGQFPDTGLPMAEIIVLCGFFMIYIIEEVTHLVIDRLHRKKKVGTLVNGRIPEIKDHNVGGDEAQPMYQSHDHRRVHENVAEDLLAIQSENQFQAAIRGFLVVLALSVHAVIEGIVLGLSRTSSSVWLLFFAISCHKYVISFCVGMQFITSGVKTWLMTVYVCAFAIFSPIGAGIGIALSETVQSEESLQNSLVTVLQGLATGTLLYVVFFEVIEKERLKGTSGAVQVTFLVTGMLCMILLEWIGEQGHQHSSSFCTLEKVNADWTFPMNFTCHGNVLVPEST